MAEATVGLLRPGDVVLLAGSQACFIAQTEHPVWPHLRLVIWRLDDGRISLDALDPRQVVGEVDPREWAGGVERVRAALMGDVSEWRLADTEGGEE